MDEPNWEPGFNPEEYEVVLPPEEPPQEPEETGIRYGLIWAWRDPQKDTWDAHPRGTANEVRADPAVDCVVLFGPAKEAWEAVFGPAKEKGQQ